MKIKTGDKVKVITGANKGVIAEVKAVFPKTNKVIVEGVNVVKKHHKPSQMNPDGGIEEFEMPIDASNVMLYDSKAKTVSRVGVKEEKGKKVRVLVKTGTVLK
ncbi:MAG: 50S ribosomal protein L24 [Erysipelothrix sp.]|nr:50S ribosomal protein L24 [Erysipelothrix sp.]